MAVTPLLRVAMMETFCAKGGIPFVACLVAGEVIDSSATQVSGIASFPSTQDDNHGGLRLHKVYGS